jgi:hypothetical protein
MMWVAGMRYEGPLPWVATYYWTSVLTETSLCSVIVNSIVQVGSKCVKK